MASKEITVVSDTSKLEGHPNYPVWSFKVRNILSRDDSWRVVDPPPGTIAPTLHADIDALQVVKNRAVTTIALSVKDHMIPHIIHLTEPDEMWKALRDLYASGTHSRKIMLRRRLANLKMDAEETMSSFLQKVKELVNDFAGIGEKIADPELVEYILMALPAADYQSLVNTLMYQQVLPTPAELNVILLQDEVRRELWESKHEALYVKTGKKNSASRKSSSGGGDQRQQNTGGRNNNSSGGNNTSSRQPSSGGNDSRPKGKKHGECNYCGADDHWMKHCPVLAAFVKARKSRQNEKTTVNLVNNFDSSSEDEFVETQTNLAVILTELNLADSSQSSDWYLDSGASKHVTGRKDLLRDVEGGSRSRVSTAGGELLNVADKGTINFPTASGAIQFDEVLYVPGIAKNLLSVGSITDRRDKPKVLFDSQNVWILRNLPSPDYHQIISVGKRDRKNGLYKFRPPNSSVNAVELTSNSNLSELNSDSKAALTSLWHFRFCHASPKVFSHMATTNKTQGLPALRPQMAFCDACCAGKQSRVPWSRPQPPRSTGGQVPISGAGSSRTSVPLALLHNDICGPLPKSMSGTQYILTIIDDFSRFTWTFFLKRKSETLTKFRNFNAMIELQGPHRIKAIRSDNGGEYISHDFVRFCEESGILRQLTQTYTPHQNGVAERKNRTLLDKARCIAFASMTPPHLWTEAVAATNYVVNRTSTRANGGITPYQRFTGHLPQVDHLRIFGCKSYVLNTTPKLKKLASRAHECIFVGYDVNSRGYRNYHKATRRILVSTDVRFDEQCFPYKAATGLSPQSSPPAD